MLSHLVHSYNHSYHRSIKRTPAEVNTSNQEDVWQTLYAQPLKQIRNTNPLKVGDRVRISNARRQFKKGYLPSWTKELFTVSGVKRTIPITYVLKDDHGKDLLGTFYHQLIQKVGEKDVFSIEAILKQRPTSSGQREVLVKWYGYPSSFNSWIPQTALEKYTG